MKKKYRIGYTVGVFDCLHEGHIILFERCKELCEYLIVGICTDRYVNEVKNKVPVYSEEQRMRIVESLKAVDEVCLVDVEEVEDKMISLNKLHFDVLFSGDDWKGSERYNKTEAQFAELGASIEYFPYTQGVSSSDIRKKMSDK